MRAIGATSLSSGATALLAAGAAALAAAAALRLLAKRRLPKPPTKGAPKATTGPGSLCACVPTDRCVLLLLDPEADPRLDALAQSFCGQVVRGPSELPPVEGKTVYLCGDVGAAPRAVLARASAVVVVRELSRGAGPWPQVGEAQVPLLLHGVAVLYRQLFHPSEAHYARVRASHVFQRLTESTKPGAAHRTGVYIARVEADGDGRRFGLLRCSSNLTGPTVNLAACDEEILGAVNTEVARALPGCAPANHVLAQVYANEPPADYTGKAVKARIKAHSDKTKDMPADGLLAFCTFYGPTAHLAPLPAPADPLDLGLQGASALARMHFRRKAGAPRGLRERFEVTLLPGSVLLVPLATNALYTHELRPSRLDPAVLPTRLGYVARCSAAAAVHAGGRTFLEVPGGLAPLEAPTPEGMRALRALYAQENRLVAPPPYALQAPWTFSMNTGDYGCPKLSDTGEAFRAVRLEGALEEVLGEVLGVRLAELGPGRHGGVFARPDPARGTPLVRTSDRRPAPARRFGPALCRLAEAVQRAAGLRVPFNSALVERYGPAYRTMAFHSDQALDLADASAIALVSWYVPAPGPDLGPGPEEGPDAPDGPGVRAARRLVVESKLPGGPSWDIPLEHNSAVVFSADANRHFRHKIVPCAGAAGDGEPLWVGVTLRASSTWVRAGPGGGAPLLESGEPLRLAGADERRAFYKLRARENAEVDFAWPPLPFTVSPGDLLPLAPWEGDGAA